MHITFSLNVQAKEGTLMFTDRAGKTVTFSKEQTVQQKVSMITLGSNRSAKSKYTLWG